MKMKKTDLVNKLEGLTTLTANNGLFVFNYAPNTTLGLFVVKNVFIYALVHKDRTGLDVLLYWQGKLTDAPQLYYCGDVWEFRELNKRGKEKVLKRFPVINTLPDNKIPDELRSFMKVDESRITSMKKGDNEHHIEVQEEAIERAESRVEASKVDAMQSPKETAKAERIRIPDDYKGREETEPTQPKVEEGEATEEPAHPPFKVVGRTAYIEGWDTHGWPTDELRTCAKAHPEYTFPWLLILDAQEFLYERKLITYLKDVPENVRLLLVFWMKEEGRFFATGRSRYSEAERYLTTVSIIVGRKSLADTYSEDERIYYGNSRWVKNIRVRKQMAQDILEDGYLARTGYEYVEHYCTGYKDADTVIKQDLVECSIVFLNSGEVNAILGRDKELRALVRKYGPLNAGSTIFNARRYAKATVTGEWIPYPQYPKGMVLNKAPNALGKLSIMGRISQFFEWCKHMGQ